MKRLRFIINPIAGRHPNAARTMATIRRALEGSGVEADFAVSGAAGEMKALAKTAAEDGVDTVVAVGGDGSVNEVACGLLEGGASPALGIVPRGSGNGLARHLGVPMTIPGAVRTILKGEVRKMDYGLMNGRPFFCTMGVGYDAKVGMDYARSGHRGLVTYADKALKGWRTYRPAEYTLGVDGQQRTLSAAIITVANANQWGNGFHIAPHASLADGEFDVTVVRSLRHLSALEMPAQILAYGIDHNRDVETLRGRRVTVESREAGFYHIDGEPFAWDGSRLKIEIVPQGLKIAAGKKKI